MNKKILAAFVIITALTFVPFTTKADVPYGELGFSDDIVPGAEFEWKVAQFDATGDFAPYTSDATLGGELLSEGYTIKIVVTEDPDNATGDWFELYLNDNLVTGDPYDFSFEFGYGYGIGTFFINPITYTNLTGTYYIYEQLIEELDNIDEETSYSTDFYGITQVGGLTERLTFSIKNDVFVIDAYVRYYTSISGGGYEETMELVITETVTVNTLTGLLGTIDMEMKADSSSYSGSVHLRISSGYAKTPYNWAFSFLGLTIIAAVAGLARKKR